MQLSQFTYQIPNVENTKELWAKNKKKYQNYVIGLGASVLIIFLLFLASFIVNILEKEAIKTNMNNIFSNIINLEERQSVIEYTFQRYYVILPIIKLIIVFIGLILYIITTIQALKNKTFADLSIWSITIMAIGAFLSIWQFFVVLFTGNASNSFESSATIFQFINNIFMIISYFVLATKVLKIKYEFRTSRDVEIFKGTEQYQQILEFEKYQKHNKK